MHVVLVSLISRLSKEMSMVILLYRPVIAPVQPWGDDGPITGPASDKRRGLFSKARAPLCYEL